MRFFRNNAYWILGILIGIGISSIIMIQRSQPVPPKSVNNNSVDESFDGDEHRDNGRLHNGLSAPTPRKQTFFLKKGKISATPTKIEPIRPIFSKTKLGSADYGKVLPLTCETPPPPPPPDDIKALRDPILLEYHIRNDLNENPMSEEELTEKEFEIFSGDKTLEETLTFLEKHQIYNAAILDQLEPRRAFEYIYAVRAYHKDKAYAERVLAEDPDNPDARACMVSYELDKAKASEKYREIIAMYPEHSPSLSGLGSVIFYDHPEEAIQHLKKANQLDPTRGFFSLGMAYERLGDVKTAWLYYRKQQTVSNGSRVINHIHAIEAGRFNYRPIQYERKTLKSPEEELQQQGTKAIRTGENPVQVVEETPWMPELPPLESQPTENQPSNKEQRKIDHARAARAEFQRQQRATQQEFYEFLEWAESIMNEDSPIDTNNFLTKELEAHLKGGKTTVAPERLVRAFEMIERYGGTKGLQHLKEKDPELAAEVERLIKEKQPPSGNTPQMEGK